MVSAMEGFHCMWVYEYDAFQQVFMSVCGFRRLLRVLTRTHLLACFKCRGRMYGGGWDRSSSLYGEKVTFTLGQDAPELLTNEPAVAGSLWQELKCYTLQFHWCSSHKDCHRSRRLDRKLDSTVRVES